MSIPMYVEEHSFRFNCPVCRYTSTSQQQPICKCQCCGYPVSNGNMRNLTSGNSGLNSIIYNSAFHDNISALSMIEVKKERNKVLNLIK